MVLDVGAGDGYVARTLLARLPAGSRIVCHDVRYTSAHLEAFTVGAPFGLSFCRERPRTRCDVLLLLDVVEHVRDDRAFVGELATTLRPGGLALVSVPAWRALFSRHDEALGHHRRYRPSELRALLLASGLEVVADGGLFHSLLLPRALAKLVEMSRGVRPRPAPEAAPTALRTAVGGWTYGARTTALAVRLLELDARLSRRLARSRRSLPGLSAWALARRT